MKKFRWFVLIILTVCLVLQGCVSKSADSDSAKPQEASESGASGSGAEEENTSNPAEDSPADDEQSGNTASDNADAEQSGQNADDSSTAPSENASKGDADSGDDSERKDGENRTKARGHYVFQPKVRSVYLTEVFGETMCETWENLVDAVMAGEDTFACPDDHTYDWVIGQFPRICFPVLLELIEPAEDRSSPVKNGVGSFQYLVPREEAVRRISAFSRQIEDILNEVFEDDYTDFEKALALYDYFSRTYEYDYDTEEKMNDTWVEYLTPCRLLESGTGICSEIAPLYSYLLMQAGVDATTMKGGAHEWAYVRINGKNYHIDPTFVLSNRGSLSYFMMNDPQREINGYAPDVFLITSVYSQENPHPDYAADDGTFSPIWDYYFESFSPEEKILCCWQYGVGWEKEELAFDYAGY